MTSPPNSSTKLPLTSHASHSERRVSERFSFSAVAEVIDVVAMNRITARVSDISANGCYLDVINVLSPATKIRIAIRHANLEFDALATVAYSLPGMGMGVTFNSVSPEMSAVLERWIALVKGDLAQPDSTQVLNLLSQDSPRAERKILGRLIGLMMRKKMLSREEGVSLLDDLLRENQE
jgi:hypothetical protein